MQISVVRPGELGPGEIAVWHSMQRQTKSLANPFLCPEFSVAVDNFRADARVAVLTEGPKIAGFFPFQRRPFGVGVPIGAGLTDSQGLIHAPGVEWDPRELLRKCRLSVWQFDHLVEGQRPFAGHVVAVAPSPVIDLADGFAAYLEKLRVRSPQFCKDRDRKARKLERKASDFVSLLTHVIRQGTSAHRLNRVNIAERVDDVFVGYGSRSRPLLFSAHSDSFSGYSLLSAGETPSLGTSVFWLAMCSRTRSPRTTRSGGDLLG